MTKSTKQALLSRHGPPDTLKRVHKKIPQPMAVEKVVTLKN